MWDILKAVTRYFSLGTLALSIHHDEDPLLKPIETHLITL